MKQPMRVLASTTVCMLQDRLPVGKLKGAENVDIERGEEEQELVRGEEEECVRDIGCHDSWMAMSIFKVSMVAKSF